MSEENNYGWIVIPVFLSFLLAALTPKMERNETLSALILGVIGGISLTFWIGSAIRRRLLGGDSEGASFGYMGGLVVFLTIALTFFCLHTWAKTGNSLPVQEWMMNFGWLSWYLTGILSAIFIGLSARAPIEAKS